MALTRKESIQDLINTNLSSSKSPKIAPADHNPVAKDIINYIDNRYITNTSGAIVVGSKNLVLGGDQYYSIVVDLGTTVDSLDYIVVGCFISPTEGTDNCRYAWSVRDRNTSQFTLLLRARNPRPTTVTFEYLLISPNEI